LIYKGAFKGAHRYCRAVNPHKIPFFLLGGVFERRFEQLNWRQRRIFRRIQQRWDARRERDDRERCIAVAKQY
jgi:hypothetical protein